MNKLLRAGVRRYTHNIVFWLALIVTCIVAVIGARGARAFYFDDFYCVAEVITFAVMISWLVGREHDEGIFRNKVVTGHTKGHIYISELILGVGFCLLMFFIYSVIFIAFNSYVFTKAAVSVLARIYLDTLLVNVCFAVIFVTLSCIIPQRAIVGIVNIILAFGIIFAAYALQSVVEQEEYHLEWEYEEQTVTDESGTYVVEIPIEGTVHKIANPDYIGGPVRVVYEVLYNILPYGHMTEYFDLTNGWFGYDYYKSFPESNLTWETSKSKDLNVTKDNIADMNVNLIWSVILNGLICAAGYVCFQKKNLK